MHWLDHWLGPLREFLASHEAHKCVFAHFPYMALS
jgi:hypothetical protein